MKKILLLLLLLLLLFIISCQIINYNVIGKYKDIFSPKRLSLVNHFLEMKENNTFLYVYEFDLIREFSAGYWKIENEKIVFISDIEIAKQTKYYSEDTNQAFVLFSRYEYKPMIDTAKITNKYIYIINENVKFRR